MSANIPFQLQEEILRKLLPVKSIIRFRSVSKEWKSLIDSPEFITDHTINNKFSQPTHLMVKYTLDSRNKYVSIVDDDIFPQHKFSPAVFPSIADLVWDPLVLLDSGHGLVCLLIIVAEHPFKGLIVLWNPSIRKSVGIPLPCETDSVGFGVCPKTSNPKIVRFTQNHTKAEVFTLSTGAWRNISTDRCLVRDLGLFGNQVVIDGVIHWIGATRTTPIRDLIITFDLASEEFGQVDLPDCLAVGTRYLCVSKAKESLVVVDYHRGDDRKPVCDVWMLLKNSVTKLFSVDVNPFSIIGFRKNGQPVWHRSRELHGELEAYEPGSESVNGLGIYGCNFMMASYTESLLLLNHSESIIDGEQQQCELF